MKLEIGAALLAGVLAACASGCGAFEKPVPPAPYKAAVVVHGDPHQPLANVAVAVGKDAVATGPDGRVELVFQGAEGEVREVTVTCPPGHQQSSAALRIRLTRVQGTRVPEYEVACPPLRRKVVVAIRAENGPFLPVRYLNQVVATTDRTGAAHFALELEPGTFSVSLDTNDRKDLKPPNPSKILAIGDQDDILLFDQRFDVTPPPPKFVPKVHVATELKTRGE